MRGLCPLWGQCPKANTNFLAYNFDEKDNQKAKKAPWNLDILDFLCCTFKISIPQFLQAVLRIQLTPDGYQMST
jgi:hypothetical protein